jgi:hypothetical protein
MVLNLTIDAQNVPVSTTTVQIGVTSTGDGTFLTEEINLEILPPAEGKETKEKEGLSTTLLAVILIIAIVIILAVVFIFITTSRKRKAALEEQEELARTPQVYDAELVGGPMSISEVSGGPGMGPGIPGGPAGLGAHPSGRKRLPPPSARVVRRKKVPRHKPDFGEGPKELQTQAYESKPDVGGEPFELDFKRPEDIHKQKAEPEVKKVAEKPSGPSWLDDEPALAVQKPPEMKPWIPESRKEEKKRGEKKKGPRVKLPGE